jgi:uncharacterized membrane protein YccC
VISIAGERCVCVFKAFLEGRKESGVWSDLVSANRKRLVRRKICKEAGFCGSVLRQNLGVQRLLDEIEQDLREGGILVSPESDSSKADRFAALQSAAERITAIEKALDEYRATLERVDRKTADYGRDFKEIVQARRTLKSPEGT